jgi:hypothetical protein
MLWSTGIVRKEIALKIGGIPDYGSPCLADFGYVVLAGSDSGCATINTSLGYQTVHEDNFGRREIGELEIALEGVYRYLLKMMSHRSDWDQLRPKIERFLGKWVVGHSLFLYRYFTKQTNALEKKKELKVILSRIFKLRYMKRMRIRYLVYLIVGYLPFLIYVYRLFKRAFRYKLK